jgi:uncharacterized Zn-binding protein involved in type VI secretion
MSIIGFIVVGDRTSHGGTRIGDKVFCPRCSMSTVIVTSRFPAVSAFGQSMAYDQDATSCGAMLYSRHNGHAGWDAGGDDSAIKKALATAAAVDGTALTNDALRFQEHFIFHDGDGKLMSNVPYVVTTGEGKTYEGDTDAEGRTAVIWTDSPDPVDVKVGDRPADSDDPYHCDEQSNDGL